jgi:hypothetical protein
MGVSGGNEIDEIVPRAKTRVNLEEILDGIAVIAIPMGALFEYWTDPDGCSAERCDVAELRL